MPRATLLIALSFFSLTCRREPQPPATDSPAKVEAPAAQPPALSARRFLEVTGEVKRNGQAAKQDEEIGATDTIVTGKASRALITLGPNSILEVREESRVVLGSSPRRSLCVHLLDGKLWSLLSSEADCEIITDHAAAAGDRALLFVEADGRQSTFCTCSNDVHLESFDPKRPASIDVHAGEWEHIRTSFTRKGKRVVMKKEKGSKAPASHLDEAGRELLARLPR